MNAACGNYIPRWWVVANIISIIIIMADTIWLMTDIPEPTYVKKIADVAFWALLFLCGYLVGAKRNSKPCRLK